MPAQRIEGNQDGAGDHNDGGEEEHGSLRHRAAPDLRLLLLLNQRPALVVCSGFDSRTRCAICAQPACGIVVGRSTFAQGYACKQHGLFYRTTLTGRSSLGASSPLRSVCLKANWLFGLNGMKLDVLDGRTSCTCRACASTRTIKISASIATTVFGSSRTRVDLFALKTVIGSTTFAR
jgi:hypothetical protein